MDLGPPISSLPDVITIEVATDGSPESDFRITCSHEDLTTPSLYNTTDQS